MEELDKDIDMEELGRRIEATWERVQEIRRRRLEYERDFEVIPIRPLTWKQTEENENG